MEEKRVEFMHHSFSVYVNILSTTTNHDQEVSEKSSSLQLLLYIFY
jgi:hypothetical protein